MKYFLAIDIGASSGRHIIGYLDNGNIMMDEVYRFPNGLKEENGHLIWDIDNIFREVKNGIKEALIKYPNIESMAIDTWGVDYVLLNNEKVIYPVYAYRDSRTKEVINKVHSIIPFERLYEITGSQFQEFNTIYQLYKDKIDGRLDMATTFLHIPEYLMYKLTGKMVHEYTNASTTGMIDSITKTYSQEIINKLGFNNSLFSSLTKPGYKLGYFKDDVKNEVGGDVLVKVAPTHDTASAVDAIPIEGVEPYISSGTWSLLGIKEDIVNTSSIARIKNYSNEYGPNYFRLQKNIMGLWIIQGLAKTLNMSFSDMVVLALTSSYKEIYDVNDPMFLSSFDMIKTIDEYMIKYNKPKPKEISDYINSTYHSLAYSYKIALDELEEITNKKFTKLYIVGGGAKNSYLNELTENYTGKVVVALPIEATALGNLKSQMDI